MGAITGGRRFLKFTLLYLLLWPAYSTATAQSNFVTGLVLDENNKPVGHATIDVVGKNNSTQTDDEGKFG